MCLLALAGELCPLILPSDRKVNDLVVNFTEKKPATPLSIDLKKEGMSTST